MSSCNFDPVINVHTNDEHYTAQNFANKYIINCNFIDSSFSVSNEIEISDRR